MKAVRWRRLLLVCVLAASAAALLPVSVAFAVCGDQQGRAQYSDGTTAKTGSGGTGVQLSATNANPGADYRLFEQIAEPGTACDHSSEQLLGSGVVGSGDEFGTLAGTSGVTPALPPGVYYLFFRSDYGGFYVTSGVDFSVPEQPGVPADASWESRGVGTIVETSVPGVTFGANGEFDITDWSGYPDGLARPAGPFRIVEGQEYADARRAADAANRTIHDADPSLADKEIHEIKPIKFGGSPTDPANKIPLTSEQHKQFTRFWRKLLDRLRTC